MARDYGKKSRPRQANTFSKQLVLVLISFFCGYISALLFNLDDLSRFIQAQTSSKATPVRPENKATRATASQQAQLPKPKFEFYTLLANERSSVPAIPTPAQAATPSPVPNQAVQAKPAVQPVNATKVVSTNAANTVAGASLSAQSLPNKTQISKPIAKVMEKKVLPKLSPKENYLVQIASFKNRQDAERMKAHLTLKGYEVHISYSPPNQGSWYRVILGPFSSRTLAEKAQMAIARTERIQGMIRKMDA